jgi:hypothetical protein
MLPGLPMWLGLVAVPVVIPQSSVRSALSDVARCGSGPRSDRWIGVWRIVMRGSGCAAGLEAGIGYGPRTVSCSRCVHRTF